MDLRKLSRIQDSVNEVEINKTDGAVLGEIVDFVSKPLKVGMKLDLSRYHGLYDRKEVEGYFDEKSDDFSLGSWNGDMATVRSKTKVRDSLSGEVMDYLDNFIARPLKSGMEIDMTPYKDEYKKEDVKKYVEEQSNGHTIGSWKEDVAVVRLKRSNDSKVSDSYEDWGWDEYPEEFKEIKEKVFKWSEEGDGIYAMGKDKEFVVYEQDETGEDHSAEVRKFMEEKKYEEVDDYSEHDTHYYYFSKVE